MSYLSDLLGDAYKEGMTEDEISTALESANAGANTDMEKLRNALTKANSEAAEYKKQLRGRQSAEEAAAAEQKALFDQLQEENTTLKRNIAVSERTAQLIGLGYAADLASATASALLDGDLDTVMRNQMTFLEARDKAIQADRMKSTPRPVGGAGGANYSKLIEEATARNDLSAIAYYTRLQAQADTN